MLDTNKILEILHRGNTAEVKKTKDGIIILEVKRKIQSKDSDEDKSVTDVSSDTSKNA